MSRVFFLLALSFVAATLSARNLTDDEKLSDLNQMVSMIRSGYAPLHYKEKNLGLNLDDLQKRYAEKVAHTQNNGDFYYTLIQLIAEFHDSHFRAALPTTQVATVPFSTDLVEGKVLIDTVDTAKVTPQQFPFERGDEVLAVDGEAIDKVVARLESYANAGYEPTARRKAAMYVTFRPGKIVPVPSGNVKFQIRHGLSTITEEVTLTWNVTGEGIPDEVVSVQDLFKSTVPYNYDLISNMSFWSEFDGNPLAENSYRCSGKTRIAIPKDATIIMNAPFVAYYHPTAKGNVGYLRIPEYMAFNAQGESEFELRGQQYEYAIDTLEKNTVGLIIDQDHNCGGSVDYLHHVMSMFMSAAFKPMQFQLLATREEVIMFKSWVDQSGENTLAKAHQQSVLNLLQTAWNNGDFMTPMTSITGEDAIYPNQIHYTKPIIVLIDEMSGSGGDAFPALMQGHGRAKLLGTRTMGAGGHVQSQPALYYSQIAPDMTKSLFYRPDGVAVENNGANPDYPYPITRDDFVYGYRNYQKFYVEKLLELVK